MMIKQDSREPEMQLVADLNNIDITFKREFMKVGDYEFENVLIERKEINDLCSSIIDKRIETQVDALKKSGKDCFLIVVGNLKDRKVEINENCVLGKIVSLVYKHNIKVLWCEDDFQFVFLLKNLFKKVHERLRGIK